MKKNILLVQSLVLLSAVATLPLLGGKIKNRNQKPHNRKNAQQYHQQQKFPYILPQQPIIEEKNQQPVIEEKAPVTEVSHQQLMNELTASTIFQRQRIQNASLSTNEYHPITTEAVDFDMSQFFDESNLTYEPSITPETISNNLIKSEHEIINISSPEPVVHNNTPDALPNPLWASVLLPVDEKDLTWLEKLTYYTSTSNQILQNIISDLETGAFDVRYKTSFDLLEEAINTAINNNDVQSLAKIAALCQQKYSISIRISDKVAQPASELLNAHYSKELTLANNTLQQKLEERTKEWNLETVACMTSIINAVTMYQEKMKKMHENYKTALEQETKRITDLRRDVSTFSCLNRSIRPTTEKLLINNQLAIPKKDVHSCIMSASEKKLNDVMENVKIISTIKGLQIKPQYVEELTQKCIANK